MKKDTIVMIGKLNSRAKMNHVLLEGVTACGIEREKDTKIVGQERPASHLEGFPKHCKQCLKLIEE
jgi:hypothetical protein